MEQNGMVSNVLAFHVTQEQPLITTAAAVKPLSSHAPPVPTGMVIAASTLRTSVPPV